MVVGMQVGGIESENMDFKSCNMNFATIHSMVEDTHGTIDMLTSDRVDWPKSDQTVYLPLKWSKQVQTASSSGTRGVSIPSEALSLVCVISMYIYT